MRDFFMQPQTMHGHLEMGTSRDGYIASHSPTYSIKLKLNVETMESLFTLQTILNVITLTMHLIHLQANDQ